MIYSITNFSPRSYPHWDTALIEADSEQEASAALIAALIRHNSGEEYIDTLWADVEIDQSKWRVAPAETPLRFILGGACR
jgi:hypothetical protein